MQDPRFKAFYEENKGKSITEIMNAYGVNMEQLQILAKSLGVKL